MNDAENDAASRMMPAEISGTLLHMAIAKQSGEVFKSPKEILDFVDAKKGNLFQILKKDQQKLFMPAILGSSFDKTQFAISKQHRIRPLMMPELLGATFNEIESVDDECERTREYNEISSIPFPFFLGNGTFCTIHDLDSVGSINSKARLARFGRFHVTRSALLSSAYWAQILEKRTMPLLDAGVNLDLRSEQQVKEFSKEVCTWGGDARIYSNLEKTPSFATKLIEWFKSVKIEIDELQAITKGIEIKGLGIPYASKHLRFIDPKRHATFDNLLSQATDIELTPQGYVDFLGLLNNIKNELAINGNIATVEMGLFKLIQPFFDATRTKDIVKNLAAEDSLYASMSANALERDFEKLGNFSQQISLYRRHGLPHIYGFDNNPAANGSNFSGRYMLRVMLMLQPVTKNKPHVFQPEHFSVNDAGLRSEPALAYITWWLQKNFFHHVLNFSLDPDEHPLVNSPIFN
jgi:hypothetical protein